MRKTEFESLKSLNANGDIIIKKADKGSAVVIQDKIDYINEGLKQLNDTNFYKQIDFDMTPYHNNLVVSKINEMRTLGEITQKCADYLITDHLKFTKGKSHPLEDQ